MLNAPHLRTLFPAEEDAPLGRTPPRVPSMHPTVHRGDSEKINELRCDTHDVRPEIIEPIPLEEMYERYRPEAVDHKMGLPITRTVKRPDEVVRRRKRAPFLPRSDDPVAEVHSSTSRSKPFR
jgi:hypothetical protein